MPGTEPLTGARIPTQSDGPLGGLQIANGISDLGPTTIPYFANASDRDTKFAAWVAAGHTMRNGLHCHVQGIGDMEYVVGTGWIRLGARQRLWTFARTGNPSDTFANGSFIVVQSGTITGAPAGDYLITARLVISNTSAIAGFQRTQANGVSISPSDPRADTVAAGQRHVFVQSGGITHAGGNLVVNQYYDATGGSPTVWSQGTETTIAYLGPR